VIRWRALFGIALATSLSEAADVASGSAVTLSAGPPTGAPALRNDAARSGRVAKLPDELALAFRSQLSGGLDVPVAIRADGTVVAAGTSLIELDRKGREKRRSPLPSAVVQAPVLLSDGTTVVITTSGECLGISPSGRVRFRHLLPLRGKALRVAPVPMSDGGVAVAAGSTLIRLDDAGNVIDRARVDEPPAWGLAAAGDDVIAVADLGAVYRWSRGERPRRIGVLGGGPSALPAVVGRSIVVPLEGRRLVLFDLATASAVTLATSPGVIDASPAVDGARNFWLTTSTGLLLGIGADGRELERVALAGSAITSDAGLIGTMAVAPGVLVDEAGRIAFVRPSGDVGIVEKSTVKLADQRACLEPIGLASDGVRVVVTCRDGTVASYGAKGE
jgi:hypothetical protein